MDSRMKPDRNLAVIRFRLTGKTYEECSKKFEISRERIHQICSEWGPQFALATAKQMAEDEDPVHEIVGMLDRCVQHNCLPAGQVQGTLRSALWEAGRFQELTLRSGFWLYRPDAMEAQMKHFMVRGAGGFGRRWQSGTSCAGAKSWKGGNLTTTAPTARASTCARRFRPKSGRPGRNCSPG